MTSAPDPFAEVADLPGVQAAVDDGRAAVDTLRGHRVLRRRSELVAAESALRGARASAAAPEGPIVQGALRVATELGSQQETWRRAPLQVLARLHTLAAADVTPPEHLGRPQPAPGVADRLAALGVLLTSPTEAPALVVAAVVHGELLSIRAFEGAHGVVARAAARLVMVTRGLDPGGVSVPEVGHVELGSSAYAEALAGYAGGSADGVAAWVVHCAEAVVLGAREGTAVCEAIGRT
jgi:hypothetical protein